MKALLASCGTSCGTLLSYMEGEPLSDGVIAATLFS